MIMASGHGWADPLGASLNIPKKCQNHPELLPVWFTPSLANPTLRSNSTGDGNTCVVFFNNLRH